MNKQRLVVYVGVCGSPSSSGTLGFVDRLCANGYTVCVIATPSGVQFIEVKDFERITGHPVRVHYKHPLEPDILPPPDVLVAAPATFNTVNKIAGGITDTLLAGIACECIGAGKPTILAPALNDELARNTAYNRSVLVLRDQGVHVLDGRIREERGGIASASRFSWSAVIETFDRIAKTLR